MGGGLPPEFADLFGNQGRGGAFGFPGGGGVSFTFTSSGPGGATFFSSSGGGGDGRRVRGR